MRKRIFIKKEIKDKKPYSNIWKNKRKEKK